MAKKKVKEKKVDKQTILKPFIINLTEIDKKIILTNEFLVELENIGFEADLLNKDQLVIRSFPKIFESFTIQNFIENIIDIIEPKNIQKNINKEIHNIIASLSCKKAIKAGEELNMDRIRNLLKEVKSNEYISCPHGRPIVIEISYYEIEKMFKRIV